MTPFWQNMLSTFVGAFLGFIFSLKVHKETQKWQKDEQMALLKRNPIKECKYNAVFLKDILKQLDDGIKNIEDNEINTPFFLDYNNYQRLFLNSYFQQGSLYDDLEPQHILHISKLLYWLTERSSTYINNCVNVWKQDTTSRNIEATLVVLNTEKGIVETAIGYTEAIKQIIASKGPKKA